MIRTALTTLALLTLLLSVACGGGPSGDASSDGDIQETVFLSIGTAPQGGAFFVVGGALADTLQANSGDTDWRVTAEATSGSQENIRRLQAKQLDLALSNAAITYFAVRGEGGWEQPYDMRAIMTLAPNVALFVTPKNSGIETLADLKGKRVVVGPAGAGFEYFIRPLLEAHGVTYDDFTELNGTQQAAVDLLSDGAADAAFLGGAVPTASLVQASTTLDLRFIPFDPAIREQLVADYSFFHPAIIPAGTYQGLDEDYQGLNVGSMHLIVGTDQDEELVYQVTKSLYENREQVVEKHPAGRAINANNVLRDTGTEFHPGALRYYREAGILTE